MKTCMSVMMVFTIVLLSGCASGPINPVPVVDNPQAASTIYMVRNGNLLAGGETFSVSVDDTQVYKVRRSQYAKFLVNPGRHVFGVNCSFDPFNAGADSQVTMMCKPKQKYYFLVHAGMTKCSVIEALQPEFGESYLQDSKCVSKDCSHE